MFRTSKGRKDMPSSRRIAAALTAVGALAVSAPVAGASAATTPTTSPAGQFSAGQDPWSAVQAGFATGTAAAQSALQGSATKLSDAWTSMQTMPGVQPRPYHMLGPDVPQP
jgi:hypothetical protein